MHPLLTALFIVVLVGLVVLLYRNTRSVPSFHDYAISESRELYRKAREIQQQNELRKAIEVQRFFDVAEIQKKQRWRRSVRRPVKVKPQRRAKPFDVLERK